MGSVAHEPIKSHKNPFKPAVSILWFVKSFEIFSKHKGYATISNPFAWN